MHRAASAPAAQATRARSRYASNAPDPLDSRRNDA